MQLDTLVREIRERMLWQVSMSYLLSAWAAVQIVDTVGSVLGFPDTFTRVAFALLLMGLPAALTVTALTKRRPSAQSAVVERKKGWRPPLLAAISAFVVLALVTSGFVGMRSVGIGPAGSLIARGHFDAGDRIVLADFTTRTGDKLMASAVTEALRIDLEQSKTVLLVDASVVQAALQRMQRDPASGLDASTALEVAQREGVKAVLAGEINAIGRTFALSARLLAAAGGSTLVSVREVARDSTDIVAAVGRLTKKLRERVGEPLRAIRRTPALPQVTTQSLTALRKYAQAREALYVAGDEQKAVALTEEAIALDSAFAMAHVQLGIALLTHPAEAARSRSALTTAFRLRERLTEPERAFAQAAYYDDVLHQPAKAITAYRILAESYPRFKSTMVLNNLALLYERQRDFHRAAEFYRRALEQDSSNFVPYINLAVAQVATGHYDSARTTIDVMRAKHAGVPWVRVIATYLASAQWDFARAEAELNALREAERSSAYWRAQTSAGLTNLARAQGKTSAAEQHLRDLIVARVADGDPARALSAALDIAHLEIWDRGNQARGLALAAEALEERPLNALPADVRPYLQLSQLYASAGEARRAQAFLTEYERGLSPELRRANEQALDITRALVAVGAGEVDAAVAAARAADTGPCVVCALPVLGFVYDTRGQRDSAVAVWQRYLATPSMFRLDEADAIWLARVRRRLAELRSARTH